MKVFAIALLTFILAGCSTQPTEVAGINPAPSNTALLVDQYYIGVDDVVTVNVWKNPDLSITVPVRPDGRISVPLVGEIVAGGKTPVDVSKEITQKLSRFIKDPQVAVILEQLNSHEFLSRIRVTGAVRTPLSMSFRQGMTVLDAILEAGGLNEFAAANRTKLFRRVDDEVKTIQIELEDILNDGDMSTNFSLQPGDILSIPERVF
ncbi:XrtA/PEP-CTERM system exopolysaccharide export protein [Pleionea sediminis]|uniref:XrtA/PEP-CTERM system exopolysaccharide export protein n=1 Tax=Pleionea sediminis TaxID=2569479 RepID=UPI001184CC6B|nr:XrtA/PEP-CTERM system exopolysaccharide export protein [Pleionea sediminis]